MCITLFCIFLCHPQSGIVIKFDNLYQNKPRANRWSNFRSRDLIWGKAFLNSIWRTMSRCFQKYKRVLPRQQRMSRRWILASLSEFGGVPLSSVSSNINSLLFSIWATWHNGEKVKGCEVYFSTMFSLTSPLSGRKFPNLWEKTAPTPTTMVSFTLQAHWDTPISTIRPPDTCTPSITQKSQPQLHSH